MENIEDSLRTLDLDIDDDGDATDQTVPASVSFKQKRNTNYSIYIYKVLKQVHPDLGISQKAMAIMNTFVTDILDRIMHESGRLVQCSPHDPLTSTLTSREVQTAVRLLLRGELATHAVSEGVKAVTKYSAAVASAAPDADGDSNGPDDTGSGSDSDSRGDDDTEQ